MIEVVVFTKMFLILALSWSSLIVGSHCIQFILKFIDDDKSSVNNLVIQFVVKNLMGYEDSLGIRKYRHRISQKHSDCNQVYGLGLFCVWLFSLIIGLFYNFPVVMCVLVISVMLVFGARFVSRINKKVNKLEK